MSRNGGNAPLTLGTPLDKQGLSLRASRVAAMTLSPAMHSLLMDGCRPGASTKVAVLRLGGRSHAPRAMEAAPRGAPRCLPCRPTALGLLGDRETVSGYTAQRRRPSPSDPHAWHIPRRPREGDRASPARRGCPKPAGRARNAPQRGLTGHCNTASGATPHQGPGTVQ